MTDAEKQQAVKDSFALIRATVDAEESNLIGVLFPAPTPIPLPTISISVSVTEGIAPLLVLATYDGVGATKVTWEWGDASMDVGVTASHTYVSAATFLLKCMASNETGSVSDTKSILVHASTPQPQSGVILSEVVNVDFAPVPLETTDVSIEIYQRFENSQGWEAKIYRSHITPVFSQASDGDTVMVIKDDNGSYTNFAYCKDVPIDFAGSILKISQSAMLHFTPDRRGWAFYFAPHGDNDLTFPPIWSGTFVGSNPFRSGQGIAMQCEARFWQMFRYENGVRVERAGGYRAANADWVNSDTYPFTYEENGTDLQVMEQHLYEIYLSVSEVRIYETWNNQHRLKVQHIFDTPLPWTNPAIMWGPWIYHLDIDVSWLIHCNQQNKAFGDISWFRDKHPLDDLRKFGAITYELVKDMPTA